MFLAEGTAFVLLLGLFGGCLFLLGFLLLELAPLLLLNPPLIKSRPY